MSNFAVLYSEAPTSQQAVNTLWSQIVGKLPEVRNATHYYAHDAHRMLYNVAERVVKATATKQTLSLSESQSSARAPATTATEGSQREVHYYSAPPPATPKVSARRVYLAPHAPTGQLFLVLLLERGGFGIFDVEGTVVTEIITEMNSDPLVVIRPLLWKTNNGDEAVESLAFLSLSESGQVRIFRTGAQSSATVLSERVIQVSDPQDAFVAGDQNALVVLNKTFAQISVLRLPSFDEVTSLSTDGSLSVAVSSSWLAYCSLPDERMAQATHYEAETAQTKMETVAKGVSGIANLLWGTTPGISPQAAPLSSVSLYDVEGNVVFASFFPHNHPIAVMSFNGDGTLLATASTQGTSVNVFQVFRGAMGQQSSVSLLARLVRGITSASICSIAFSPGSVFAAVATAVGTCHLFDLSTVLPERGARKKKSSTATTSHVAPQISPTARVRSAPTPTPPNPSVFFDEICRNMGDPQHRSMTLHIASNRVVVTHVAVQHDGIKPLASAFLSTFQGPRHGDDDTAKEAADVVDAFDERKLYQQWNASVELEVHPAGQFMENFSVDGLSPFGSTAAPEETAHLEWVDCNDEDSSREEIVD